MRILITGGAGFIGSHLAGYHLEKKDAVWVVDNLSTGRKSNLASFQDHVNFRFTEADLLTWDHLEEAAAWADGVYHLAAIVGQKIVIAHPVSVISDNILGCERLLKALSKIKKKCRLLIASSSEVYGADGKSSFREDSELYFPSGKWIQVNYSLSKYVNESMALSYIQEFKLDCVIARLFNTTGPHQTGRYGMVVPRFVDQALNNESITVFGNGKQTRSFCDIRDTVSLLNSLMTQEHASGQIFNVGNDREITILELAQLVKKRTRSVSEIMFVPYREAYGMEFEDTLRRCPDLTKVRQFFGFEPKWSLESTIDEIVQARRCKNATA
jgi:UDP-glucose 4-epimerase